jgi:hypothetical protein
MILFEKLIVTKLDNKLSAQPVEATAIQTPSTNTLPTKILSSLLKSLSLRFHWHVPPSKLSYIHWLSYYLPITD